MREELDLKNNKQACHLYKKFTKAEGRYKKKKSKISSKTDE